MKWSSEYATGIQQIDKQHMMLFKMSEDFREALDNGQGEGVYGVILGSVTRYARAHFGFEEECMHRNQCPAAEINRAAHHQFIDVLSGFRDRYEQGGFVPADAQALVGFIDEWLANHIGRIDVTLKACVENPTRR